MTPIRMAMVIQKNLNSQAEPGERLQAVEAEIADGEHPWVRAKLMSVTDLMGAAVVVMMVVEAVAGEGEMIPIFKRR